MENIFLYSLGVGLEKAALVEEKKIVVGSDGQHIGLATRLQHLTQTPIDAGLL